MDAAIHQIATSLTRQHLSDIDSLKKSINESVCIHLKIVYLHTITIICIHTYLNVSVFE